MNVSCELEPWRSGARCSSSCTLDRCTRARASPARESAHLCNKHCVEASRHPVDEWGATSHIARARREREKRTMSCFSAASGQNRHTFSTVSGVAFSFMHTKCRAVASYCGRSEREASSRRVESALLTLPHVEKERERNARRPASEPLPAKAGARAPPSARTPSVRAEYVHRLARSRRVRAEQSVPPADNARDRGVISSDSMERDRATHVVRLLCILRAEALKRLERDFVILAQLEERRSGRVARCVLIR